MKIYRIETMILKAPTGANVFYSSQARFPERTSTLVKITTDDGIEGWGEGGQYGPGEPVASAITDILGPRLIGEAADAPVRIWERNYAFSRDFGRTGHTSRRSEPSTSRSGTSGESRWTGRSIT